MTVTSEQRVHVVAGALVDGGGRVLLARRHDDAHQGGLWEFPGGKSEPGEGRLTALERELREEIGVVVERARPLIRIDHDYADRAVRLDVWRVDAWSGEPRGIEGQAIRWAGIDALDPDTLPAADAPVLAAIALPDRYLVTPEPGADRDAWLGALERSLAAGVAIVQIRARSFAADALLALAREAMPICRAAGARVLVNGSADVAAAVRADGVHLPQARLDEAPTIVRRGLRVGASCHDAASLARAAVLGAEFAVLGPVRQTASHADAEVLGWDGFERLVSGATLPVYALGGMLGSDVEEAWQRGGQGIAAIRGLWSG